MPPLRSLIFMAATLSTTLANQPGGPFIRKYTLAWVSHTDGTVANLTEIPLVGEILRVVFNPGTAAPTDDYDVTLIDEDGLDVLAGQGANRDTANSEHVCPGVALKDGTTTSVRPVAVNGYLTLTIANAGDSKNGTITIYTR